MPAPDSVLSLVERFREHRDEYLSAGYNEATLRREFLEPMFKALGWDVDNTKGYAEAYKEVVHEDAIKISGATKAPDYAFRLGGVRKFFVEAKKPSVDVKGDPSPAYQLRRYAWSAKLPLSILTDFHEFAVYDCTKKPDPADTAATGRILYLTCEDYSKRWEEIAELFSPEAIQKGAFDKHAASAKKKGTTTVDDAFLKEIETWRDLLAHNLALRNPGLTQRELNTAVQTTIDRIIFLRICEDRGIEDYGVLQGLVNGTCIYARMLGVFRAADERYNSGLFHFRSEKDRPGEPDTLTRGLVIDDKALKEILEALYYPKSPYEFSVLPADILGHVYEQFLGKVIRLTAGHHAVVEEKPEVKKAGGVYYTPTYIVDYIVKNTVGKLLEGMAPKEADSLRILDPACGSGSFLLGAYQLLLDWHQAWYAGHDSEKWARGRRPRVFRGQDGEWRLTTAERKRILLDCIYGVDIDPQAVEVTKLSLLLKVLEGEDAESIGKTLKLLRERALPDLGKNIQCGNSLIGTDFYDDRLLGTLTEEDRYRINAFDWEEGFPEPMKAGGFDAVIGNPPYIQQSMSMFSIDVLKDYWRRHYTSSMGRLNTFGLFTERALTALVRPQGVLSFIVPNTILTQEYYEGLRRLLLRQRILSLTTFEWPVFRGAVVETAVFVVKKQPAADTEVAVIHIDNRVGSSRSMVLPQPLFESMPAAAFVVTAEPRALRMKSKIDQDAQELGGLINLNQAIALKEDRAASLFPDARGPNFRRVLDGRNIGRYSLTWDGNYLAYDVTRIHSCKRTDIFELPEKLLLRRVGERLTATYDDAQYYALNTLVVLTPKAQCPVDLKYILGLLNSQLMTFYYRAFLKSAKRTFSEVQARQVARLPIRVPGLDDRDDADRYDGLVRAVASILSLQAPRASAKTDHEKALLQRQIDATDRKIDELVYELYRLTAAEIRIVEETTRAT